MYQQFKMSIQNDNTSSCENVPENLSTKQAIAIIQNEIINELEDNWTGRDSELYQEQVLGCMGYYSNLLKLLPKRGSKAEVVVLRDGICALYYKHKAYREAFGDTLVSNGFVALAETKLLMHQDEHKSSSQSWTLFRLYHRLLLHATDSSTPFRQDVISSSRLMDFIISHFDYKKDLNQLKASEKVYITVQTSISIIHNVSLDPAINHCSQRDKILKILEYYTTSDDEEFKTLSIMILGHMLSEEEFARMENTEAIPHFIRILQEALANDNHHRVYNNVSYSAQEITDSIAYLAVADRNKNKMLELGLVPLLLNMMQSNDVDEKRVATRALWLMSFSPNAQATITNTPGCIDTLTELSKSENAHVKKMAVGTLWELNNDKHAISNNHNSGNQPSATFAKGMASEIHKIFISYQHMYQPVVLKIKERLKRDGFHVWMDVDEMQGTVMMDAIADGIQKADLVLICMSRSYKDSPNCRSEGEYTFQLKRSIVPLMLERRYKPDGWLGLLLGAKHYINFDGKFDFEEAYSMLVKALKKLANSNNITDVDTKNTGSDNQVGRQIMILNNHNYGHIRANIAKLGINGLSTLVCDDTNIDCLLDLKSKAPEFFFKRLQEEYNLVLPDIIKVMAVLTEQS